MMLVLERCGQESRQNSFYRLCWVKGIPARVFFVLWEALNNALITMVRLQMINPLLDVSCPLCSQERESGLLIAIPSRKIWQEIINSFKHPGLAVDTIEAWAQGWFQNLDCQKNQHDSGRIPFILLFGRFGRIVPAGFSKEHKRLGEYLQGNSGYALELGAEPGSSYLSSFTSLA